MLHPEGLELLPYQLAGVRFCASRPGVLLADEMGLGKTVQAICALNALQAKKALIICTASLKLNWRDELATWLTTGASIGVACGKKWPDADIVIINYDILVRYPDKLRYPWPVVVLDEAHNIRNRTTQRAKEVLKIPARRRLLLTGTPLLNRPKEAWMLLRYIDPPKWNAYRSFVMRYCAPWRDRWGRWHEDGAANLDELAEKLKPYMIRRLKADVLTELPAKTRQTLLFPVTSRDVRDAITVERELELADPALKGAQLADLARARKTLGMAKVPAAVDHILDVLESERKVVVFAHHREVIAALLSKAGVKAVSITGDTSMKARNEAVHAFQNDPEVRLFVGNLQAAGVGLTLTAASVAIFVEQDWTPGVLLQAEDRIHRIGQDRPVLIQYLVFDGSLDARMVKSLARKERIIQEAIKPTDQGAVEMTIESILERIAVAMERTAAATEENTRLNDKWTSYLLNEKMAEKEPTTSGETEAPSEATASAAWDPYTAPIQGKYGKDKREVLEAEAKKHGVAFTEKTTGAQLHEAVMAAHNAGRRAERDEEEAPSADFTPVVEDDFDIPVDEPKVEAKKYTPEETRKALTDYAKRLGAKDAGPITELIKKVTGKSKFGEVAPGDYGKLIEAAEAAGAPAEDF